MKAAVIVSGQPRFTNDLINFIANLDGCTTVDWHILLWKNNPPPDHPAGRNYIPDTLRYPTVEQIHKLFENKLPQHHSIKTVTIEDYLPPPMPNFKAQGCTPQNVWPMWWGWYRVSQQCQQWETLHGKYDRIIKARLDIGFPAPVDINNYDPTRIIVANNGQHGYNNYQMNDLIGISSSDNIHTWCRVINHAEQWVNKGCSFHPETVLCYHLRANNLRIEVAPWTLNFRSLGSDWHAAD